MIQPPGVSSDPANRGKWESIGLSGRRYLAQIEGERLAPVGLRVVVAATPCRGEAQRDGGAVVDA